MGQAIGFLAVACALTARAAVFHVASKGDDKNPGTAERPFASLERAREAVREFKRAGAEPGEKIEVLIHPGVYRLRQTWTLGPEDSGAPEAPIVYRAAGGGEVRLLGGAFVTGWRRPAGPEETKRLDPAARAHVWAADLRAQGIEDLGRMEPGPGWGQSKPGLELFFRRRPMTPARWPNEGFVRIAEVLGKKPVNVRGRKGTRDGIIRIQSDRLARWVGEPELMAHGFWFWDWADQRLRVASVDPARNVLTLTPEHHYGFHKGQWFYVYNALSELDAPGEWHLDRQRGLLYFWPPQDNIRGEAMVSLLETLVSLRDVSHVTLRGLTFEAGRGTLLRIEGGASNRVAACVFRNGGSFAVRAAGRGHTVAGCDIFDMGDGGIVLSGGDRRTLTPGGLKALNNHIHHYARWNPVYKGAVALNGVGNTAAHNLIHHAPHSAIFFSGNEHRIEYNEIYSVCRQSNDAGAIYAGRDWTMRGNVIRHNYLHHIYGFEGRGCVGVYLDDQLSGEAIVGNVFWQVPRAAFIGGGRDNLVANNLFIDCRPALHIDARGLGWAASGRKGLTQKLERMPYKRPPWSERYPELLRLLEDEPMAPKDNRVVRNICAGGRWEEVESKARPYVYFANNIANAPIEKAGRPGAWQADPELARQIRFEPIPFERIGLQPGPDRASWPVRAQPPELR